MEFATEVEAEAVEQGGEGYRSSHARRGGPRERAHSRQRRPREDVPASTVEESID